jgi:hypothetical protein
VTKRTLRLRAEVLSELVDADLTQVVGGFPPPTVPQTQCTICKSAYLLSCLITCPCS